MTPEDATAHAKDVLAQEHTANSGYLSNGSLQRHAHTAMILLDIATQLEHAQTELVTLRRHQQEALAQSELEDGA